MPLALFTGLGLRPWQDGVSKEQRDDEQENTRRLLAIELPEEDMEELSPRKRLELGRRIESAEAELADLQQAFLEKGYDRAATYVGNAKDRLFGYLRTWMATGIACPRATSIIENLIRELVRRLKKIGWNWRRERIKGFQRLMFCVSVPVQVLG